MHTYSIATRVAWFHPQAAWKCRLQRDANCTKKDHRLEQVNILIGWIQSQPMKSFNTQNPEMYNALTFRTEEANANLTLQYVCLPAVQRISEHCAVGLDLWPMAQKQCAKMRCFWVHLDLLHLDLCFSWTCLGCAKLWLIRWSLNFHDLEPLISWLDLNPLVAQESFICHATG